MTIHRSQIKEAFYNPRTISESAEKRLKQALKLHGLVSAVTWNSRTGNCVGGHQRLKQLDALEGTLDYELTVCVIDVPLKEEKALSVILNNPSIQGEWDFEKLKDIASDGIEFSDLGFTNTDIELMFGGDKDFETLFVDTKEVDETKNVLDEIKRDRKEQTEKLKNASRADFYFIVICESSDERIELFEQMGIPLNEEYIGAYALKRLLK